MMCNERWQKINAKGRQVQILIGGFRILLFNLQEVEGGLKLCDNSTKMEIFFMKIMWQRIGNKDLKILIFERSFMNDSRGVARRV